MKANIDDYAEILLVTKCPCCDKKLVIRLYQKMQPGQTKRCYGPNNVKATLVEEEE